MITEAIDHHCKIETDQFFAIAWCQADNHVDKNPYVVRRIKPKSSLNILCDWKPRPLSDWSYSWVVFNMAGFVTTGLYLTSINREREVSPPGQDTATFKEPPNKTDFDCFLDTHMGQIPQDGNFGQNVILFKKK